MAARGVRTCPAFLEPVLFLHPCPGVQVAFLESWFCSGFSSFQVFDLIQIMTEGGPGRSTNVLVYRIYQEGFQYMHYGYASAMAYFLFAVILVVTLIQFRGQKKWVTYM